MASFTFVKPERLWLKTDQVLNEKWVQDQIAADPTILGLGDMVLKDKERRQPRAGRLDLLLQDSSNRRYEVEIQLGSTDESHIIRTIEYWDIERKRYPQYEHCAVIVAEDITARFLNVISLFNGTLPLIAIQMSALRFENHGVALVFTTVMDELTRGLDEEDEGEQVVTNRSYWEERSGKDVMQMLDELFASIRSCDAGLALAYKKFYVGLARKEIAENFVIFCPRKNHLRIEIRLPQSDAAERKMEEAGVDFEYAKRYSRYFIKLTKSIFAQQKAVLDEVLKLASDYSTE